MSDTRGDPELARLAADLARSLRDLQRELEPQRRGLRPPSLRELLRFTDEVAIPAAVLILETNVRALRLLQRAIRVADPESGRGGEATAAGTEVRDRAAQVSRATLDRLDDALADLQDALEGRPEDEDARQVLDEARALRDEIDERLAAETGQPTGDPADVPVDVDAELQSLKDEFEDGDDDR